MAKFGAKCALLLAALAGVVFGMPAPSHAQSPASPNIVIMLTDDQRWDAIGFV